MDCCNSPAVSDVMVCQWGDSKPESFLDLCMSTNTVEAYIYEFNNSAQGRRGLEGGTILKTKDREIKSDIIS